MARTLPRTTQKYRLHYIMHPSKTSYEVNVKDSEKNYKELHTHIINLYNEGFCISISRELEEEVNKTESSMPYWEKQFIYNIIQLSKTPQSLKNQALYACTTYFDKKTIENIRRYIPDRIYQALISKTSNYILPASQE